MNVGDRVKLKKIPYNNMAHLGQFLDQTGDVIDKQYDRSGRAFVRVMFDNASFYEDLLAKRLEVVAK